MVLTRLEVLAEPTAPTSTPCQFVNYRYFLVRIFIIWNRCYRDVIKFCVNRVRVLWNLSDLRNDENDSLVLLKHSILIRILGKKTQQVRPVQEMKLPTSDCSGSDLPEGSEDDVVC